MATAQDVVDRVRRLINDETSAFVSGVRWTDTELVAWVSEAQREIVKLKPESNPVTARHVVTDGQPRQRLSASIAYCLIRVEANGEDV